MTQSLPTVPSLPIVVLDARNSLDFLEAVFALYGSGTAFAICRSGTDIADYPALLVLRRVATGPRTGWAAPVLRPLEGDGTAIAQVVFSSGTEGRPKAIAISRTALADVEDRLIEVMRITSEIREYIGVPVTYSFGLGRARVVARAGGQFYLPERFDPVEIRDMLAADEINAISAVPSLWRLLIAQPGFLGDLGEKVRWIEIGSQYMPAEEKQALRKIFPKARIVQHYGLTEASRSTFLVIDEVSGEALESVGRMIGQTAIQIGPEGEICIRGPHLATGIVTDSGQLQPVASDDGWLHTRDRGEIRDGWLYYLGRLDDQINLAGIKLASESLEAAMSGLVTLEAGHFALSSVQDPLRGETLLLAHDLQAAPHAGLLQAALVQVLAEKGVQASAGQIRMLALETLPRTDTGKIRRKDLRALWESRAPPASGAGTPATDMLTPAQERIAAVWRGALGPVPLHPESGFYDVGGDSLGAMQIGLAMEAQFPRDVVRATLEGRSLAEIATLLEAEGPTVPAQSLPPRTVKSWGVNLTRGFMVIAVVMSHWMPGVWERIAPHLTEDPLALISRMGTPGFAIVFGLGIACFMLEGYPTNQFSIRRRMRFSLACVALAMVILAVIKQTLSVTAGNVLTPRSWGEVFFSVLGYYLLALASVPVWLRLLHGRVMVVAALGIPLMWVIWLVARAGIGTDQWDSPLEWLRLMIVAKYSYFYMTPLVLAGIVLGGWMMHAPDPRQFARQAGLAGFTLFACGLVIAAEMTDLDTLFNRGARFWSGMLGAMIYIGFATMFLAASVWLVERWRDLPLPLHLMAKFLILLGGLALPVYVLHEMVIPVKNLLVLAGLPGKAALMLVLGGFFGAIGYGMWRLDRMYFRA